MLVTATNKMLLLFFVLKNPQHKNWVNSMTASLIDKIKTAVTTPNNIIPFIKKPTQLENQNNLRVLRLQTLLGATKEEVVYIIKGILH